MKKDRDVLQRDQRVHGDLIRGRMAQEREDQFQDDSMPVLFEQKSEHQGQMNCEENQSKPPSMKAKEKDQRIDTSDN